MQQQTISQRWLPLTGIVFVILFLAGVFLTEQPPSAKADFQLLSFYREVSNRIQVLLGGYLLALSGLAFLLFLHHLRRVIHDSEGEPAPLSGAAYGSGIVFVGLLLAGAAASIAVSTGVHFDNDPETPLPEPELMRYLPALGYTLIFMMGMFAAALMIAATALASFHHAVFPAWFNWLSVVCAIALLFAAPFFVLMFALPIWLGAVAVLLALPRPAKQSPLPLTSSTSH